MNISGSEAVRLLHGSQILLALYGARFSLLAITKLRKYEATSEKLAEWSQTAEDHLAKTRTTQASGVLCLAISLLASSTLAFAFNYIPYYRRVLTPPAILVAIIIGQLHMKKYWAPYKDKNGKNIGTRIPLPQMGEYNAAERMTENLIDVLGWLEYSWAGCCVLGGLGLYQDKV